MLGGRACSFIFSSCLAANEEKNSLLPFDWSDSETEDGHSCLRGFFFVVCFMTENLKK